MDDGCDDPIWLLGICLLHWPGASLVFVMHLLVLLDAVIVLHRLVGKGMSLVVGSNIPWLAVDLVVSGCWFYLYYVLSLM